MVLCWQFVGFLGDKIAGLVKKAKCRKGGIFQFLFEK
jgi:hypothetical protein